MRIRAALFDYGHTILDFTPAQHRLLDCYEDVRALLEAEAVRDIPHAESLVEGVSRGIERVVQESYRIQSLDELDIVSLFEAALSGMGLTVPRHLCQRIAVLEHRAMASEMRVPPENLEVLSDLRERGLKIGLVSNAHFLPAMMREDIDRLDVAPLVDVAVFSAEIGVRKPHPAVFSHVLDGLGVEPCEALFVGDRLRDDIAGAQAIGMVGVLTHQFRQEDPAELKVTPDHIIFRLSELPALLSAIGM